MEKKTQQTIYLTSDHKEKLEEIALFKKRLGSKKSYGGIISDGIDMLHMIVASDYFVEHEEEYPRWTKRWSNK